MSDYHLNKVRFDAAREHKIVEAITDGQINPDFDQKILGCIREGRGEAVAALSTNEIERDGGNGGQEIRNWIAVLGALPGVKGEVLAYEPVPEWLTGCGAVWLAA